MKKIGIIGAGLSGLTCAHELHRQGMEVVLWDGADGIGGRVRTDVMDGFLMDRGFQVFLPAYPAARSQLDYQGLDLRKFFMGAGIWHGEEWSLMGDPLAHPFSIGSTCMSPAGSIRDKLLVARLKLSLAFRKTDDIFHSEDSTTRNFLEAYGFSSRMIDQFFRPFMGGVFLDSSLSVSSRYFRYLYRFFGQSSAALPGGGMESIPRQLARNLPESAIRLNSPVVKVHGDHIWLASDEVVTGLDGIVVAADWETARRLLPGYLGSALGHMNWYSNTTVYYRSPVNGFAWKPQLYLNADPRNPINSVVALNAISPAYAPDHWWNISVCLKSNPNQPQSISDAELKKHLSTMFPKAEVSTWEWLREYRIPKALPTLAGSIPFSLGKPMVIPGKSPIVVCGDHTVSPSIQGAMESGLLAAQSILHS